MDIKRALNNRIKSIIAITPANWWLFRPIFRLIPVLGPYAAYPVIGPVLRWLFLLIPAGKRQTQSYVLNLNKDVTDQAQNVILPIDMMKEVVKQSRYLVIMDKCLCRSANGCTSFPHDHACIFLGEGSRIAVQNGIGHEVSVEEAMAHIDKAAQLGLIGHALWIEFEQYVWGIKDEEMRHWLEICFCCPCCCSAFKLTRAAGIKEISGLFRSIGWKAVLEPESCTLCTNCVPQCPVQALSLKDNRIVIDEEACLGCGFCAARCPQAAIKLHLQKPLKGNIHDYFTQGGLSLDI
jgi:Pyruvate/2-oxoacid:ferredoxin oxidoreductase delta subunit